MIRIALRKSIEGRNEVKIEHIRKASENTAESAKARRYKTQKDASKGSRRRNWETSTTPRQHDVGRIRVRKGTVDRQIGGGLANILPHRHNRREETLQRIPSKRQRDGGAQTMMMLVGRRRTVNLVVTPLHIHLDCVLQNKIKPCTSPSTPR